MKTKNYTAKCTNVPLRLNDGYLLQQDLIVHYLIVYICTHFIGIWWNVKPKIQDI